MPAQSGFPVVPTLPAMTRALHSLLSHEFPLAPDLLYLNHAAVAPWPRRTAEAVQAFAAENMRQGARDYPRWLATESRLREQLRRLLNAASGDDIALLKNTSEALSVVAHGLDWGSGDNVVISDQEFPSNRVVWESLEPQGVEVRQVSLAGPTPENALAGACDRRTRLLSISSVQYASGLRMNLERLGEHCRHHKILFCVDAIQSIGALPMDVRAIDADFVMADGHKWMLGPEGVAVFYCRAELRPSLALRQYGWHMVQDHGDYDRKDWAPAASSRRFECGSPNMLGIHALSASLSLLLEVGMETVSRYLVGNASQLIDLLRSLDDAELVTPKEEARRAGIVSFRRRGVDPAALFRHLTVKGVVCALRGGAIRFSPHFHTPEETLARAVGYVREFRSEA
jgi:cysteine desulfurase/selenocysteine lyase